MLKYLVLCLLSLSLVSCKKKPSCELTATYSDVAAERVGAFFACENKAAISLSIQETIEDLKMCEKPVSTGLVAAVVCKPVSNYVADLVIAQGLPKAWKCTGGVGGSALASAIYAACTQIPF